MDNLASVGTAGYRVERRLGGEEACLKAQDCCSALEPNLRVDARWHTDGLDMRITCWTCLIDRNVQLSVDDGLLELGIRVILVSFFRFVAALSAVLPHRSEILAPSEKFCPLRPLEV